MINLKFGALRNLNMQATKAKTKMFVKVEYKSSLKMYVQYGDATSITAITTK